MIQRRRKPSKILDLIRKLENFEKLYHKTTAEFFLIFEGTQFMKYGSKGMHGAGIYFVKWQI
jgi:hypothetical protein